MYRKTQLNILIGINGSGKTTFIKKEVIPAFQRFLVITPHPGEWCELPTLKNLKDVETFQQHARIVCDRYDTIMKIIKKYKGGGLLLDDFHVYLSNVTTEELRALYISRRQRGIDMYMSCHGPKSVPPMSFEYLSFLILFACNNSFKLRKEFLNEKAIAEILQAQEDIEREVETTNPHAHRIILIDKSIRGEYEQQQRKK